MEVVEHESANGHSASSSRLHESSPQSRTGGVNRGQLQVSSATINYKLKITCLYAESCMSSSNPRRRKLWQLELCIELALLVLLLPKACPSLLKMLSLERPQ